MSANKPPAGALDSMQSQETYPHILAKVSGAVKAVQDALSGGAGAGLLLSHVRRSGKLRRRRQEVRVACGSLHEHIRILCRQLACLFELLRLLEEGEGDEALSRRGAGAVPADLLPWRN